MAIQTVAKITEELAFGIKVWNEEIESYEYTQIGIQGQSIPDTNYTYNVATDADGNLIIPLTQAQYLHYTQFETIPFNPIVEEALNSSEEEIM